MDTLSYVLQKYKLSFYEGVRLPIEIPNMGRDQLGDLFRELGFKTGAEIGVEQGVYAEILCKSIPRLTLYCIDAWKSYRGYRDHTSQEKLNRFCEITQERLKPYACHLVRKFSMDAVKDFKDESLDFVYIDGNHDYINVAQDIYYWSKKVRKGGIVAGHDYIDRKDNAAHVHVKRVLPYYTESYNITPWFVIGSEAKVEGQIRDSSRSWMFIKQ